MYNGRSWQRLSKNVVTGAPNFRPRGASLQPHRRALLAGAARMGACRATAGSKSSDVDKSRERLKRKQQQEDAARRKDDGLSGPVTDEELANAAGVTRAWLVVARGAQRLDASFKFQMCITLIILAAALLIGFVTLPTAQLIPDVRAPSRFKRSNPLLFFWRAVRDTPPCAPPSQFLRACEWTINGIFILEILLKMAAKKWRPHRKPARP